MNCTNCGKKIHKKAVVCVHCGEQTSNPVPNKSYQPMAGFFLSFFLPPIGFIVSLMQLVKALVRKGLWFFPLLGVLIGLFITVFIIILVLSWASLGMELSLFMLSPFLSTYSF